MKKKREPKSGKRIDNLLVEREFSIRLVDVGVEALSLLNHGFSVYQVDKQEKKRV